MSSEEMKDYLDEWTKLEIEFEDKIDSSYELSEKRQKGTRKPIIVHPPNPEEEELEKRLTEVLILPPERDEINYMNKEEVYSKNIKNLSTKHENIQHQFRELVCALTDIEYGLVEDLSSEDIETLKKKWPLMFSILLYSLSKKLIDQVRKCSFYNIGSYDSEDVLFTSLKILTKFARMKVFGLNETNYALTLVGIKYVVKNEKDLNEQSEAIFCLTLNKEMNTEIDSEEKNISICKSIENGINDALCSPIKLGWLIDMLKEDEVISEFLEEHNTINLKTIQLNVLDIFPGSEKVIVQLKYLDFPEDHREANCFLRIIQGLLENLPSVSKVRVDEQDEMRLHNGVLRMKVNVGNKYFTRNNKKKLKLFLQNFIDNFRKKETMERADIEATLLKEGITPESVARLLENLFGTDKIEFDLHPSVTCHVETMRLKNLPLWPSDQMRLLDLSNENRFKITDLFRKNFGTNIWEEVATKLDLLNDDILFFDLQKEISVLGSHASPYFAILNKYKEKSGTIGGLLKCLDKCRNTEEVTSVTSIIKIDEMINAIQILKEYYFKQWMKKYQSCTKISGTFVASYEDFKKAASNATNTRCVLGENITQWNDNMRSVIEEGDQIWMWREVYFASYSHVGIYVGQDSIVHVSSQGLSGIIKKDPIKDVIKNSKCFIIKHDPDRLTMNSGTPKERALACLDPPLKFTYSVTKGTCEVFANCISLGIWNIECACVQGDEHPHIDNLITVVNGLTHFKTYKTQQKDLLTKLAKRLQMKGFEDADILQISRSNEN